MSRTFESPSAQALYDMNLTWMAENLENELAEAARRRLSPQQFLDRLIGGEQDCRRARSIERHLSEAGLRNCTCTLEQFDFTYPTKINEDLVRHLFTLSFLKENANVTFIGGVGLGKTHLARALACEACRRRHSVLCVSAMQMVNTLVEAAAAGRLEKAMAKYTRPEMLLIDELGYIPLDRPSAELVFQVFARRYDSPKGSIVITTNRPFKEWGKTFANDSVLTSAILDRVIHRCELVTIEGTSYRMMKARTVK